jgi:hypothetical protein
MENALMPFLKTSHDGEIHLDHRASPGFTREQAERLDVPFELTGEGKQMHAPTLGCPHCGSHIMLNPMRKRPRAHCQQCNMYICDTCDAVRHEADYVHRPMNQIREMVQSGKWQWLGGPMSRPLVIPK